MKQKLKPETTDLTFKDSTIVQCKQELQHV